MVTLPIRYPLDPTGLSSDNKIIGEIHTLPNRKVRAVAPGYGAFFSDSIVVRDSATGQVLTKNVQYTCTEMLEFPTGRYGKEIDGIILIKDQSVSPQIEIDYQTLGGEYSTNSDAIISMLNSAEMDNRPVAWGDIIGKPDVFTPAQHYHDAGDIYGFEYVVHAIERVRSAILIGDDASHDQIYRYIDASYTQLNQRADTADAHLSAHIADMSNPHQTTKAQVGLGSVDNFATATTAQAQDGTATNLFTTPAGVAAVVSSKAGALLTAHINDHNNPHQTTAAQVGLGSVSNFGNATQTDAETGSSNTLFMTPLRVSQAIAALAGNALNAHIANTNNPHQVTAAQVGLGSVQNYGMASTGQAQAGADNATYMTPQTTAQAIASQVGNNLAAHVANTSNPHQVTAAQVGLGQVSNFLTANDSEAQAATRTDRFMTPRGTALAINNLGASLVNQHASRIDNPHQVTATQVGLGNVNNFTIATNAQAVDSSNNSVYMTPASTYQAITQRLASGGYATYAGITGAQSTWAAVQTFLGPNAGVGVAGNSGTLFQSTGASASISFLRPNQYGINFGLDSDNVIRLGGWSNGTNVYRMQIDPSGNATFPGNVTAYSDEKLKKDIKVIEKPLDRVKRLMGVTFTRIDTGEVQTGLIAQQVLQVLPEAVQKGKDNILSLAYGNMAGLFVECIKSLMSEVENLKMDIKFLKNTS